MLATHMQSAARRRGSPPKHLSGNWARLLHITTSLFVAGAAMAIMPNLASGQNPPPPPVPPSEFVAAVLHWHATMSDMADNSRSFFMWWSPRGSDRPQLRTHGAAGRSQSTRCVAALRGRES